MPCGAPADECLVHEEDFRDDSGSMIRFEGVMNPEAGGFERRADPDASKSYTRRRAEILADLDRRTRLNAEAKMRRRYDRPWWRIFRWRDAWRKP